MKTYRIISTSWALSIFSSLVLIFTGIILSLNLFRNNNVVYWISCLVTVALSFYLQRYISRGEVLISLTNDIIIIKWKQQYIFHNRRDREIPLAEIKSYKYEPDKNFDLFRITLTDDTELNFWHFSFTRDDFETPVYTFPDYISKYNKKNTSLKSEGQKFKSVQKIERGKTIFETATSPFLALFAVFCTIAIPVILILNPNKQSSNYAGIAAFGGAIFFLSKYFKYRKKGNVEED